MKKSFLALTLSFALTVAHGQTNVSGGIYSNTTWTKVNSPYIVTDTVVVFPGVTLTIQPGVVVKFDNSIILEIRQAKLIAIGTAVDSITFTSNAASPTPGIYIGIYLNGGSFSSQFNYCNFRYAKKGVEYDTDSILIVKNSNFYSNYDGIWGSNSGGNGSVFIDTCNFSNQTGAGLDFTYSTTTIMINYSNISNNGTGFAGLYKNGSIIRNCTINNNQTGLFMHRILLDSCQVKHNQIGISSYSVTHIKNCFIDSNSVIGISANGDSVINCKIRYNGVGIETAISVILNNTIEYNTTNNINDNAGWGGSEITGNIIRNSVVGIDSITENFTITKNIIENHSIGIKLNNSGTIISCNKICNNTTYDLQYGSINNISVPNNYWCTPDSISTTAVIYDGYDNVNYGLVYFMPIDSLCYLATSINEIAKNTLIKIYPNPFSSSTTLHADNPLHNATLTVYNCFGQAVKEIIINNQSTIINRDNLPGGLYFVRLTEGDKIFATEKLIVTDK